MLPLENVCIMDFFLCFHKGFKPQVVLNVSTRVQCEERIEENLQNSSSPDGKCSAFFTESDEVCGVEVGGVSSVIYIQAVPRISKPPRNI